MRPIVKNVLLTLVAIIPGVAISLIAGYYALVDWAALRVCYATFERAAQRHADMNDLFVAESFQNIHRINLFADGVWTLLGLILVTLGIIGWAGKKNEAS